MYNTRILLLDLTYGHTMNRSIFGVGGANFWAVAGVRCEAGLSECAVCWTDLWRGLWYKEVVNHWFTVFRQPPLRISEHSDLSAFFKHSSTLVLRFSLITAVD